MTKQELIEKRAAHILRCDAITKETRGGAMTTAQREEYRTALDGAQECRLILDAKQYDDAGPTREEQQRAAGGAPRIPAQGDEGGAMTSTRAFGGFLQQVAQAGVPGGHASPELAQRSITGMGENIGSDGGFLVNSQHSTDLLERVYSTGQIASRIRRLPPLMPGFNGITLPYVDETSRATGSRLGGVQMYWGDEGQQLTASKPKIGKMEMSLKKLTGLCYSTGELLQDAAQLGAIITDSFIKEMVFNVEDAVFRGTGAGRPLGFMSSDCKITVAKEPSQAADTITFNNVASMMARINPSSIPTAVWLANIACLPELLKMSVPIKNVGGTDNVGGSGAGLIYNPTERKLLGLPVLFVEYCEGLGDEGDLVLCALGEYLLIDRAMQGASSIHVRFDYDETAFRFIYRCDGQPAQKTALTPYKGTATTSPFITLQAR